MEETFKFVTYQVTLPEEKRLAIINIEMDLDDRLGVSQSMPGRFNYFSAILQEDEVTRLQELGATVTDEKPSLEAILS